MRSLRSIRGVKLLNATNNRMRCLSTIVSPLQDIINEAKPIDTPNHLIASFNPAENARKRPQQLPSSRYRMRPPRFYRGPLHPVQPPPPTDIYSREFVPGPFMRPRLSETYDSVFASDILTLAYSHIPPGTPEKIHADRMRPWTGDDPYLKNRTARGPKGRDRLLPVHRPITYKNIPALKNITVHSHVSNAAEKREWLHVASMAIQSITNVRCTVLKSKINVTEWGARANRLVSLTATVQGEDMYHFLAKVVELVLPRLKDWKGVSGMSGDQTGNFAFGLGPEQVQLFPEIQFNYSHYPPKMIPGLHIQIETTAKSIKEGRLLMMAIGIPFAGELRKK